MQWIGLAAVFLQGRYMLKDWAYLSVLCTFTPDRWQLTLRVRGGPKHSKQWLGLDLTGTFCFITHCHLYFSALLVHIQKLHGLWCHRPCSLSGVSTDNTQHHDRDKLLVEWTTCLEYTCQPIMLCFRINALTWDAGAEQYAILPSTSRCISLMVKHLLNSTNLDCNSVSIPNVCITVSVKKDTLEKKALSDFTLFFLSSWLQQFNGVNPNVPPSCPC